jgi:GT2 family glycosyltransferase
MKISVIVTNWNGLPLLKKNLPIIIKHSQIADEIIVADDASTDSSLKYLFHLQKTQPRLKIIGHQYNLGFGANSNYAVKQARGDLVVILNNDIYPSLNYIRPALKHFTNHKTFGVGFAETNNENYGQIFWKNGYLQHLPGKSRAAHISGWLSGGSSIIRRNLFLKLGGFDPVYSPFYFEDLDLGYRAWKSGYQLLWEPKCRVEHHHESTMSKFPKRDLDYIKERNRLLIVWRNITDSKMLRENKLFLFFRILWGPNYFKIVRAAKKQLSKYPPPLVFPKLSDHQIFKLFR